MNSTGVVYALRLLVKSYVKTPLLFCPFSMR